MKMPTPNCPICHHPLVYLLVRSFNLTLTNAFCLAGWDSSLAGWRGRLEEEETPDTVSCPECNHPLAYRHTLTRAQEEWVLTIFTSAEALMEHLL